MSRQPTDPAGIAGFVAAELARHGLDPDADTRPSTQVAVEANRLIDGCALGRTGLGLALLGERGHLSPRVALGLLADYAAGSRLDPLSAAAGEMGVGADARSSARDTLVREGLLAAAALDALAVPGLPRADAQAAARAARLCGGLGAAPSGVVAQRAAGAFLDAAKVARAAGPAVGNAHDVERFATAAERRARDLGTRLERDRSASPRTTRRDEER